MHLLALAKWNCIRTLANNARLPSRCRRLLRNSSRCLLLKRRAAFRAAEARRLGQVIATSGTQTSKQPLVVVGKLLVSGPSIAEKIVTQADLPQRLVAAAFLLTSPIAAVEFVLAYAWQTGEDL